MDLKRAQKYNGLILNESTVIDLFNICISDEDTKTHDLVALFLKALGYSENGQIIALDKDYLLDNKEDILFLFGQLKAAHGEKKDFFSFEDLIIDYTGKPWTANQDTLMKLLYLGASQYVRAISPFVPPNHEVTPLNIEPTLSPEDPNFYPFIKEYRKKLVKKLESREPGDE